MARISIFCAIAIASTGIAQAQAPDQFYKGNKLSVVIGYSAGGGYDYYARVFARYAGKHIPGNPSIVAQNMPGAGSLIAANYVFNVAPRDGTVLGVASQGLSLEDAFQNPAVQFKSNQFNWIGRMAPSVDMLFAWHTSPIDNISDVFMREVMIAGTGAGSTAEFMPKVLNGVLGTKFKVVSGYSGANQAMLALERGEVEAASVGWNTVITTKRDWLTSKSIKLIVQLSPYRSADVPDVPHMVELGKTEEQREILAVYASGAEIGRAIFTTPNTPADRVDALRTAFNAMSKDPELLSEMQKTGSEFDPLPGDELQKIVAKSAAIRPSLLEVARKARE